MEHCKNFNTPVISEDKIRDLLEGISEQELKQNVKDFFLIKLNDYVVRLNDMERSIMQDGINPDVFWQEFKKKSETIVQEGDAVTSKINSKKLQKAIKDKYRTFVGQWLYQGKFMERGYKKPKGFPGDYEIIEGVYNNVPWVKKRYRVFMG